MIDNKIESILPNTSYHYHLSIMFLSFPLLHHRIILLYCLYHRHHFKIKIIQNNNNNGSGSNNNSSQVYYLAPNVQRTADQLTEEEQIKLLKRMTLIQVIILD